MERRYVDELNLRFDQVCDTGFATITSSELMRWWDRKRETPSIWQDLQERWEERDFRGFANKKVPLHINYWRNTYTLAWGEPEWLVPVSEWAAGRRNGPVLAAEDSEAVE